MGYEYDLRYFGLGIINWLIRPQLSLLFSTDDSSTHTLLPRLALLSLLFLLFHFTSFKVSPTSSLRISHDGIDGRDGNEEPVRLVTVDQYYDDDEAPPSAGENLGISSELLCRRRVRYNNNNNNSNIGDSISNQGGGELRRRIHYNRKVLGTGDHVHLFVDYERDDSKSGDNQGDEVRVSRGSVQHDHEGPGTTTITDHVHLCVDNHSIGEHCHEVPEDNQGGDGEHVHLINEDNCGGYEVMNQDYCNRDNHGRNLCCTVHYDGDVPSTSGDHHVPSEPALNVDHDYEVHNDVGDNLNKHGSLLHNTVHYGHCRNKMHGITDQVRLTFACSRKLRYLRYFWLEFGYGQCSLLVTTSLSLSLLCPTPVFQYLHPWIILASLFPSFSVNFLRQLFRRLRLALAVATGSPEYSRSNSIV